MLGHRSSSSYESSSVCDVYTLHLLVSIVLQDLPAELSSVLSLEVKIIKHEKRSSLNCQLFQLLFHNYDANDNVLLYHKNAISFLEEMSQNVSMSFKEN